MARASTTTLLTLDRFAALSGIHPLHFNQITVEDLAPATTCGMPILQYSWQDSARIGREEIAQAIGDAEAMLEQYLGFPIAPRWVPSEVVRVSTPNRPELFNMWGLDIRGLWASIKLDKGYFIQGGRETKTLIERLVNVVYTDVNHDGYKETATITVSVPTNVPVEEIAVYYPSTLIGSDADDGWEIHPTKVVVNSGVATITCRREMLVVPDMLEGYVTGAVDGLVDANFLDSVDVYRHWADPQNQTDFIWEALPNGCSCGQGSCPTCTFTTQHGCLSARDVRLSIVHMAPGKWNSTNNGFDVAEWSGERSPDRALVWYKAGYPLRSNGLIDPRWEKAVTYLALTRLDRPLCNCNSLRDYVKYWREDLGINIASPAMSTNAQLSDRIVDNPFGTTRGAIYAWNIIQPERIGEAVTHG